jgi:hypothetical protein
MNGKRNAIFAAALLVCTLHSGAAATTIYRWTDAHGQPHFGDTPPAGHHELVREGGTRTSSATDSQSLRPAERRALERLDQQAEQRRQVLQSYRRQAQKRRTRIRQTCRKLREELRGTRDATLRKRLSGRLRQQCW